MYQKLNNVFILNFNFVCENIIICWNNNGELRMIYPINSFTKTNYNNMQVQKKNVFFGQTGLPRGHRPKPISEEEFYEKQLTFLQRIVRAWRGKNKDEIPDDAIKDYNNTKTAMWDKYSFDKEE